MYDHYLAIDYSSSHISLAKTTSAKKARIKVLDFYGPDMNEIRSVIKKLKGSKILTIEETNGSNWVYAELREVVDKIIVCDPHRNKLLLEGPKDDQIDATKLVMLLKADLRIAPNGYLSHITFPDTTTVSNPRIVNCLSSVLYSTRFPSSPNGGEYRVSKPFIFEVI